METTKHSNIVCGLDIRDLERQGTLTLGKSGALAWMIGGRITASVGYLMQERGLILTYSLNGQTKGQLLPIIYRGSSPGVKCGGCGRRVSKLILNEKGFKCQRCSGSLKTVCVTLSDPNDYR